MRYLTPIRGRASPDGLTATSSVLLRLAAVVALLLLLALPALTLAQGRTLITDPGGRLDEQAIREAARPLVNRGATVAVYFVDSGGADDLVERMIDDGIARADGTMLSNAIVVYAAFAPQNYSSIVFGDRWSDALAVNDNYEVIRRGQLNPGLADEDYTRGVVTALGAIEQAIISPPRPGGGIDVDTTPIAIGVGGLAAAGAGAFVFSRRRRAAQARAAAQQRLKDAREGAGAMITELGLRFRTADEKAKYDKVSYAPEEVARLQQLQGQVAKQFAQVQNGFKETGEQLERHEKPTNEQLDQAAAGYDKTRTGAEQVSEKLRAVEELRARLDAEAREAREALDRAKKA